MSNDLHSRITKFIVIFAAYLITAQLGLLVPYKESIATLMWLPSGLAVGAIMRWGNLSLPAIYLAAAISEFSIGVPLLASMAIAASNTLAPYITALLLRKARFNESLERQKDIGLMIGAALTGMLISSGCGVVTI
jgi:integral membrane sensor domain MASE1